MKQALLIVLFCTLFSYNGVTQNTFDHVENFDYSSNSYLNGIDTVTENFGEYGVLNQTFTFNANISSISVELDPSSPITFVKQTSSTNIHGQVEWVGTSNGANCSSCELHLLEDNNILEGSLFKANKTFAISHIGGTNYFFYERSDNNSDCDTHLYPSMPFDDPNSGRIATGSCDTYHTVSMLIAYTPEFAATFPSTNRQDRINDFLTSVIESVNESYIESDLNVRVRLAFSYQTPDSEYGNKDDDFGNFTVPYGSKYNEVFAYIQQYNIEVSILLVAANVGGRADRGRNMGMYGKSGADWNYGVAHEIGHMLELEHNREEFSWAERIFLDGKKAYGYRGPSYKTVMSYGSQTRVALYSDFRYHFPDGGGAGNNRAKARNHAAGNLSRIITGSDPENLLVKDKTISSSQTATFIATSEVTTENFVTNNHSRIQIEAPNSITLKPGTHLQTGSNALLRIAGNSSDLQTFFSDGISISQVSNATCSNPCVDLEIDGYRDDFTFEWFQDDNRIGCGTCGSTTSLGSGKQVSVCFANTDGDPNEQRTFRVVVSDMSRCTLGTLYLDGKLYCGINFRAEPILEEEVPSGDAISIYPNPTSDKKIKLAIKKDKIQTHEIVIRNLSGSVIFTKLIDNQSSVNLEIDLSNKPAGIYILDYCAEDEDCITRKIILE